LGRDILNNGWLQVLPGESGGSANEFAQAALAHFPRAPCGDGAGVSCCFARVVASTVDAHCQNSTAKFMLLLLLLLPHTHTSLTLPSPFRPDAVQSLHLRWPYS
jgi:hypothetical protein